MTHITDVTNGASLEDCHTNFFALADLSGFKWRRLCADSVLCVNPLDDPVLLSYTKCLSAGNLCVWRRVVSQKTSFSQPSFVNETNQLAHSKELWIFWYGKEPDLTDLVGSNLREAEQGSWETGLSYECRTLLFKALHNLIEKCLLSKGFTRLGRFFVEPQNLPRKNASRSQIAFAFSFFVHGESTVCASVDMRVAPSVYPLQKCHLAAAQAGEATVRVILGPYGMGGTLTGQGYKCSDSTILKMLNEWHCFYPLPDKKEGTEESDLPDAVEILIGGVHLKYPTSYVFVVETDHVAACGRTNDGNSAFSSSRTNLPATSTNRKPCLSLNLLTPPTSPERNSDHGDAHNKSRRTFGRKTASQNYLLNCDNEVKCAYPAVVKLSVSEETSIGLQAEGSEDAQPMWEFHDPSTISKCPCSSSRKTVSSSAEGNLHHGRESEAVTCGRLSKSEKSQPVSRVVPFHKRNCVSDTAFDGPGPSSMHNQFSAGDNVPSSLNTYSNGGQAKQFSLNPTLQSGSLVSLPQLHTPLTQPSSVDSHSNVPSVDTSSSHVFSSDPIMPTLSPHPPVVKEEPGNASEHRDVVFTHSPNADIGHTINIKEKSISDEMLSPFHESLLTYFENAKASDSTSANAPTSAVANDGDSSKEVTPESEAVMEKPRQMLKRPFLPVACQENCDDELTMRGYLYDYGNPSLSFGDIPPPSKRRRIYTSETGNDECAILNGSKDCTLPYIMNSYIPEDPYEFTDFDDGTSSESATFRIHVDVYSVKEEEKTTSTLLPSPPEIISPVLSANATSLPHLEGDQHIDCELPFCLPSPVRRNVDKQQPKFIREEDLTVTLHDLDDIFETSSSDSDDMFPDGTSPTKTTAVDDIGVKSKTANMNTGLLELSRMFPTPPSFEQNATPSPCGGTLGSENAACDSDAKKDKESSEFLAAFLESMDPAVIWSPYEQQMFLESSKYSILTDLPSSTAVTAQLPEYVYRSSWVERLRNPVKNVSPTAQFASDPVLERQANFNQPNRYLSFEDDQMYGSGYPVDHVLDQRFLLSMGDMQSPASSSSSYINKQMNSVEIVSMGPSVPEAHSLFVNLLLSDSMLNVFKDHNFDSCSLCVCNMNIKGADVGVNLPNCLMPTGNDEPQYKCTCGFSAVVYRHQSYCAGMFFEDEWDIAGFTMDDEILSKYSSAVPKQPVGEVKKEHPLSLDQIFPSLTELIRAHCKSLCSSFSLLRKPVDISKAVVPHQLNALLLRDACEVCFLALEDGQSVMDNISNNFKRDESLKSSCLHKWPYSMYPLPSPSQEMMLHLDTLKPLLQEAVHKRNTLHMWDVTHVVSGPLTWREFHILAGRGTEDQCEPQPIPSVAVGYDKDCLSLSPFALKYWDKLLLEPYSLSRDVAYIVVTPESDYIISHVKSFFRELSSVYERYRMGKHIPITKVLRDGIMRVGKNAAMKLAEEPVAEWFNQLGDNAICNKLKLYARVCRHRLAPHLSTLTVDKSLLENPAAKCVEKPLSAASSPVPSNQDPHDQSSAQKPSELDSDSASGFCANATAPSCDASDDEDQEPPAIVIYIVEPFTFASVDPSIYRMVTAGLMNCYSQMLNYLPDAIRNCISLQLLSLDSILCMDKSDTGCSRIEELRTLAFSVFSQCHRLLPRQSSVKSLTGFGPAAAQDLFLSNKDIRDKMFGPVKSFNQALVLASLKDKQTELGEMFGDGQERSGILYCSYCLTEDRKWLLASCTNDKGELMETTVINVFAPKRARRKCSAVRRLGLQKLLDFILEVLSSTVYPWRIIIGRLGRLGHGELRDWAVLLSRKSLLSYSHKLHELCKQCSGLGPGDTPSILSACLVSMEPDPLLRIMPDQYTPDDRFSSSSCNTCKLSTPEDATCTHILVFPTSATMQSSQATFHQEHIDPLPGGLGDDIFEALNDDDINVDQDMNDIFRWTESPTQSPSNSPHHGLSQPSSPSAIGHHSPFHQGGPNRFKGLNPAADSQDEPLQLLQQPLALGYYVSTAKTGPLPPWFWSSCPHLINKLPVFLKFALLIHLPSVHQSSDDILHTSAHNHNCHPLDSNFTTDVLRYVLEGYNALSWLSLDPTSHDRRSCLPVHIQILMQLYRIVENIL